MSASAILKLQRSGFTQEQVEALAEFMDTQAASKADLEAVAHRLETKITDVRNELKADIAEARTETKAGLAETKADLKAEMAAVRVDVIRWVVGLRPRRRKSAIFISRPARRSLTPTTSR
ncbi:hypothetical protein [Pararhodospirillum photometricum]|uniref:hypothetical protein n=1 Tax=Pararhodospirillum photometricum TaxID=1084 RepID=UPI0002EBDB42|nr:hypothetical protein [Pararhodospirillum photometricum]